MESIKLDTRLGNCNLSIRAQLQNDEIKAIAEFGLQYLVWHVIPASAYNSKSKFQRDTAFSDALAKHLVGESKDVLGKYFSEISIETSKWEKPDPVAKLAKAMAKELEITEADALAMIAASKAKSAKTEPKQESEESTSVEV